MIYKYSYNEKIVTTQLLDWRLTLQIDHESNRVFFLSFLVGSSIPSHNWHRSSTLNFENLINRLSKIKMHLPVWVTPIKFFKHSSNIPSQWSHFYILLDSLSFWYVSSHSCVPSLWTPCRSRSVSICVQTITPYFCLGIVRIML